MRRDDCDFVKIYNIQQTDMHKQTNKNTEENQNELKTQPMQKEHFYTYFHPSCVHTQKLVYLICNSII